MLIADSTLPYKEKLVAGKYKNFSQLPPTRDDPDWELLLRYDILDPPELIELKNVIFLSSLNSVSTLVASLPEQPAPISDDDKNNITITAEGSASDFAASGGKAFKGLGFSGQAPHFDPTDCAEDRRPVKLFSHFEKSVPEIENLCLESIISMSHALAATVVVYNDLSKVSETKTKASAVGKDLTVQSAHLDQIKKLIFTDKGMGTSTNRRSGADLRHMSCATGVVTGGSTADGHFKDEQGHTRGIIEAKGSSASPSEALRQAAAGGTNVAYSQLRLGVAVDDIIVPVIGTNGLLLQVGAVYMLKPSFPTFTLVSKVLDLSNLTDLLEAARLIGSIKVMLAQPLVFSNGAGACPDEMYYFSELYHSKPLTLFFASTGNLQTSLHHYFRVMGHLHKDDDCRSRVVFPICVREFRDDLAESRLIYPKLSTDYRIGLPATEELRTSFLTELKAAVKAFHKIGVVHLDLYLSNVMWRVLPNGAVELKVIDWDAAHFAHEPLTSETTTRLRKRNGRRIAVREKAELLAEKPAQHDDERMFNFDWSLLFVLEKYLHSPMLQVAEKTALDAACVRMLDAFLQN